MANTTVANGTTVTQGWVSAGNDRGTFNIITECSATFILCSWSCICCNIPASNDSLTKHVLRKCWLTFISLLGPEYLLYIALGQYISAKRSLIEFRKLGFEQWTMTHAFYADMGGFRIRTTDGTLIPINSKSLLFLTAECLITPSQLEAEVMLDRSLIEDRNKSDCFVRTIALAQTCWFMLNLSARFLARYDVSTLEITILGYIAPTLVTHWLWWHKPRDVLTANVIKISLSVKELRNRLVPDGSIPWHFSPLDPVERDEFHGSRIFRYWLSMVQLWFRTITKPFSHRHHDYDGRQQRTKQPRQYRSDNDILKLHNPFQNGWIEVLPALWNLGTSFLAWNAFFPTTLELWLWRASCVGMTASYCIGALWEALSILLWSSEVEGNKFDNYRLREEQIKKRLNDNDLSKFKTIGLRLWLKCHRLRINPLMDDSSFDVSLRLLIPATILAACYLVSRAYILAEDFAGFRNTRSDLYTEVSWTQQLPHFG